jgi:VCBS repeat-containing protein
MEGAVTVEVNLSNNQDIDGILWGWSWGDGGAENLTYSFPTGTAEYTDNGYVQIVGFNAFNPAQQTIVRTILANAASFSNLTFTETAAAFAVLRYANADQVNYTDDPDVAGSVGLHTLGNSGTAEANPPENGDPPFAAPYAQGDSWYTNGVYTTPALGNFQFAAGIMHETGHNLGLKHGHVTQSGHGVNFPMLPADHNSYEYSVMTYSQFPGDTGAGDNAPNHPTTFMQNDIAALQYMYGANYGATANNTDTVYTWSKTTGAESINGVSQGAPIANYVLTTVWDGGGTDTYDLSNYTTNLSVDLNPGQWVILDTTSPASSAFQRANLGDNGAAGATTYFARGNIANAQIAPGSAVGESRSLIENANGGSGNDTLKGNSVANVLRGNGGNDTMDGGDGTDTAYYTGTRLQHLSTLVVAGTLTIADQRVGSPNGTDTVSNFESYRFDDGTFNQLEVLNRAPVLSSDAGSPHNLSELLGTSNSNSLDQVSGSLGFTDSNDGDTHTASKSLNSATWSGGVAIPASTDTALANAMSAVIAPDGTNGELDWDFKLADKYADFLALNETLTVVYDMTVADHHVGSSVSDSSTKQVTILFTGTNDALVLGGGSDLSGSIAELPLTTGSLSLDSTSGLIEFFDLDLNDRPTASIDSANQTVTWQDATHNYTTELTLAQIAAIKAAFTISAVAANVNDGDINWNYDIVDGKIDFLAVNESITLTTRVIVNDHNGSTITPNVVVTITGANDAPIAFADSNGTAKLSTLIVSAANGLIANDTDPDIHDQDGLFVQDVNGSAANVGLTLKGDYGSITIKADGSYVYVATKATLPAKIVAQDTFTYTLADGNGGTDTSTLNIVVFNPGVSYKSGVNTTLTGSNGSDVLDGSFGGDILKGGSGSDVLIAGDGNVMTGGLHADIFLFRPDFGENIITDFTVNTDALQFDNSIFANAAAMFSHATNTAAGVVIEASPADTVTLLGVTLAQLHTSPASLYFI